MKDIDVQVNDVVKMIMKKNVAFADIQLEKDWLHERKNNSMMDKPKIVHKKHYIAIEQNVDVKDKQIQYVENKIVDVENMIVVVVYLLGLLDKERKR